MTNAYKVLAGLVLLVCCGGWQEDLVARESSTIEEGAIEQDSLASEPRTYFLIVGKPMIADPEELQARAEFSVRKVADAIGEPPTGVVVEDLAEGVMTKEQYRRGGARERVTGDIFRDRLADLAKKATPRDTVVIYTHTHGRKNGFEESQSLGGIVLDLPVRKPEHAGTFLWDEYVDSILGIPAKNVVVLTMSCFAGGLVDYLDSPEVKERWKGWREVQGRNLIVLTSQDEALKSNPIVKDGVIVNPFTCAVVGMLSGEADGFRLENRKPAELRSANGELTVGELVDYVLHTTEYLRSEEARRPNTARPRMTGCFERDDVLGFGTRASKGDR